MKQYDIYIFDFDGTLCDTKESLYQVFEDSFAAVGIYGITHEECEEFMHHTLKQAGEMKGVQEEDFPAFYEACIKSINRRETIEKSKPFLDVFPLLDILKNAGKTLAVCSGNTTKHIKEVMEYLNWPIEYFSAFMGSDIYKNGKPSAEPILMCLDVLGEKPSSRVVYVGDSLQDAEAALNAGIDGVLIDRDDQYKDFKGTRIHHLEELLK